MKLRSFFYGLVTVVSVLLLIGAGGFSWIVSQSPLTLLKSGQGNTPSAAIFVPKQAPAMVSLLVNPDRLESFRQVVAHPGERKQARAELAQLKQGLLANTGLSYERDVQPWLGDEITLAITTLDIDRDRKNGRQPGYLLAIATRDAEQSREFLQLFWQKRAIAGTDLIFEQYQGVKLIYTETLPPVPVEKGKKAKTKGKADLANSLSLLPNLTLASAVVGDQFVLFANDPKVLRDAITNVQAAELNLGSARFYQTALDTLNQPRIGLTFVNLPSLAAWLETETTSTGGDGNASRATLVPPATVPQGKYQSMAIALELDRHGLLADTALIPPNGKGATSAPTLTKPVGALQYLPALSPISASGTDLDQVWTQLSETLKDYNTLSQLVNQPLETLQSRWKLDLAKDIFAWVKGEYAIGLLPAQEAVNPTDREQKQTSRGRSRKAPSSNPAFPLPENDWIFVAQRTRTESTKQAIAHLDEIAKQQGYGVGELQLGDQRVSAWTRLNTGRQISSKTLEAEVQGVHASVGNYEIFTTSVTAMEAVLQSIDRSLLNQSSFEQAIAPFLQPNNGYLYLDWNQSRPILEHQFPILKVIQLAGQPLFSHLKSLTVSSYGSQSGVQRAGLFINLS